MTDDQTLAAALLHDVLEDTPLTARDLAALVPLDVVTVVEELTKPTAA